jgi:hypothetical protein
MPPPPRRGSARRRPPASFPPPETALRSGPASARAAGECQLRGRQAKGVACGGPQQRSDGLAARSPRRRRLARRGRRGPPRQCSTRAAPCMLLHPSGCARSYPHLCPSQRLMLQRRAACEALCCAAQDGNGRAVLRWARSPLAPGSTGSLRSASKDELHVHATCCASASALSMRTSRAAAAEHQEQREHHAQHPAAEAIAAAAQGSKRQAQRLAPTCCSAARAKASLLDRDATPRRSGAPQARSRRRRRHAAAGTGAGHGEAQSGRMYARGPACWARVRRGDPAESHPYSAQRCGTGAGAELDIENAADVCSGGRKKERLWPIPRDDEKGPQARCGGARRVGAGVASTGSRRVRCPATDSAA